MKRLIIPILLLVTASAGAQQFITAGSIEYEVRTNTHKAIGDGFWADMFKDKIPQFSTSYYKLTFSDDKGVYKFDHKDEKTKLPWDNGSAEDDIWYNDYAKDTFTNSKFVFDNTYLMNGSLINVEWKLSPTETREIAGFNCRKATGIIFDSVYIFAYYTDEITVSGGPMGVSGLPGMILGLTAPRMFTSWIATKLELAGVSSTKVVPPTKGRKKQATELRHTVENAVKDWGTWGQQQVWRLFL